MEDIFKFLLVIGIIAVGFVRQAKKEANNLKSASNLNGNLNCSKELEHYAS